MISLNWIDLGVVSCGGHPHDRGTLVSKWSLESLNERNFGLDMCLTLGNSASKPAFWNVCGFLFIWLAIVNNEECHFKFQDWSWDAKVIISLSAYLFSLSLSLSKWSLVLSIHRLKLSWLNILRLVNQLHNYPQTFNNEFGSIMGESTSTMFMSIGMVRELSHLVSNCQLKKIQVSRS